MSQPKDYQNGHKTSMPFDHNGQEIDPKTADLSMRLEDLEEAGPQGPDPHLIIQPPVVGTPDLIPNCEGYWVLFFEPPELNDEGLIEEPDRFGHDYKFLITRQPFDLDGGHNSPPRPRESSILAPVGV